MERETTDDTTDLCRDNDQAETERDKASNTYLDNKLKTGSSSVCETLRQETDMKGDPNSDHSGEVVLCKKQTHDGTTGLMPQVKAVERRHNAPLSLREDRPSHFISHQDDFLPMYPRVHRSSNEASWGNGLGEDRQRTFDDPHSNPDQQHWNQEQVFPKQSCIEHSVDYSPAMISHSSLQPANGSSRFSIERDPYTGWYRHGYNGSPEEDPGKPASSPEKTKRPYLEEPTACNDAGSPPLASSSGKPGWSHTPMTPKKTGSQAYTGRTPNETCQSNFSMLQEIHQSLLPLEWLNESGQTPVRARMPQEQRGEQAKSNTLSSHVPATAVAQSTRKVPSAYNIFFQQQSKALKDQHISFKELSRTIGERWKALHPRERFQFKELASRKSDDDVCCCPCKSGNKRPKRALSAYNIFFRDERLRLKQEGIKQSFSDLGKGIAGRWRRLSPLDRAPYLQQAGIDKVRYQQEKAHKLLATSGDCQCQCHETNEIDRTHID